MTETFERARLEELAQFLRTRRARLLPEAAGFEAGGRRRTPGLRRQEVAQLAGMSVDWYTWMEQARPIQVSGQVLESLAKALRLDAAERRHLYRLALRQVPLEEPGAAELGDMLRRFLDGQGANPAVVYDLRMTIVGWNAAACLVYGDYAAMDAKERNTVWRAFLSPDFRSLLGDGWEAHARKRLAQFRANYAKFADDPWWMETIAELREASPEFRVWWPMHDILDAPEGSKLLQHPAAGTLAFGHVSFMPTDAPDLTVTVNLPLDEFDTAAKMKKLLAGG